MPLTGEAFVERMTFPWQPQPEADDHAAQLWVEQR